MAFVDWFVLFCVLMGSGCAVVVALHPNILYAAISLAFTLLSVAGLYGALGADFLAGVQLIIYVGAVIIVILFAIMMSEDIYKARFIEGLRKMMMPFVLSVLVALALVKLILATNWGESVVPVLAPTTKDIGIALTTSYALPFQFVAIVLLSGLIGATVVARPNYTKVKEKLIKGDKH